MYPVSIDEPRPKEQCRTHSVLLKAYRKAVARFSLTLDALEAGRATVGKAEYQRLKGYMEQARLSSEQCRVSLELHVHEHGCAGQSKGAAVNASRTSSYGS